MKLFIKNTTSFESLLFVRDELNRLGLHDVAVEINEIDPGDSLNSAQCHTLREVLERAGIELFEDKKDVLVQRIKNFILKVVYHGDEPLVKNLSVYLKETLHHDYTYMSNLFSERQQTTIERFYICHKIERVKELLLYEKLTLTEIADKMHYSSLAHLSNQFKKVTGLTTSQFKQKYSDQDLPPASC
ncbi:MAG: helix-turn-helix domain-containing protein [Bacteroidota bacterium]|nr:helix-turn-helix domain-containing protein [Bacteroidota bacterium]